MLAYLSVGEAEEYRFYWRNEARGGRARFVDRRNPDWPGDWLVRYWDPDWQAKVTRGPQSWTVEVAIPFVELGLSGLSKGDWALRPVGARRSTAGAAC